MADQQQSRPQAHTHSHSGAPNDRLVNSSHGDADTICVLPRTASFQLGTTAYRVFSAGHCRVPSLYALALLRYPVDAVELPLAP